MTGLRSWLGRLSGRRPPTGLPPERSLDDPIIGPSLSADEQAVKEEKQSDLLERHEEEIERERPGPDYLNP